MKDWIVQISAGTGPVEVRRFVAKLSRVIATDLVAEGLLLRAELRYGSEDEPTAVQFQVTGDVAAAQSLVGTYVLVARSPDRGRQSRKRWFVGVELFPHSELWTGATLEESDVRVSTCRSGGPGGQHVNRRESAVRAVHVPSGIAVRVSSDNSFTIVSSFGGQFHDNTIELTGVNESGGAYPRIFEGGGGEFFRNTIDVDSASRAVNLWVYWGGGSGARIHHNTIDFASNHGRLFHFDSGANGFEIFDNRITITSSAGDVYVLRARGESNPLRDITFHHNTVDSTGASTGVSLVSYGGGAGGQGVDVHHNVLRGAGPIRFYGNSMSDSDVYCNRIEHAGGGIPLQVRGAAHDAMRFSHNRWTTEGDSIARFLDNPSTGAFEVCDNEGWTGDAQNTGSVDPGDVVFTTGACSEGSSGCAGTPGAR